MNGQPYIPAFTPERGGLRDYQRDRWNDIKQEALANNRPVPQLFPPNYHYKKHASSFDEFRYMNERLSLLESETDEERTKREAIEAPEFEKAKQQENEYIMKLETKMNQIKMFAAMRPPQPPIYIFINDVYITKNIETLRYSKEGSQPGDDATKRAFDIRTGPGEFNIFGRRYYLLDNNDNFIYANSLSDAIAKVKNQLSKPNSILQESYNKDRYNDLKDRYEYGVHDFSTNSIYKYTSYTLRISSNNTISKLQFNTLPPLNEKFGCWTVLVTNANPSRLSNFRMSFRKIGGYKTKNKKSNRKMKSIKRKPKTVKKKTSRRK